MLHRTSIRHIHRKGDVYHQLLDGEAFLLMGDHLACCEIKGHDAIHVGAERQAQDALVDHVFGEVRFENNLPVGCVPHLQNSFAPETSVGFGSSVSTPAASFVSSGDQARL